MHLEILYFANGVLAVDKPAGIPVHATLDKQRLNLLDLVKQKFPEYQESLILHHRLDVKTQGVALFSFSATGKDLLTKAFASSTAIQKKYRARIEGELKQKSGRLENFLQERKIKNKLLNLPVKSGGKKAILEYEVIEEGLQSSIVEISLVTGRMHQIRTQFASIGHPLVGDELYGATPGKAEYYYLHAFYVEVSGLPIIKSNFHLQNILPS